MALSRTNYGELMFEAGSTLAASAGDLLREATARGKLPAAYDEMSWGRSGRARGKRIGEARRLEVYDVAPNGHRVLVCAREVEGTKYGQRTTSKTYYVVARHGRGVRVIAARKAVAAKAAKAAGTELGSAIEVALGRAKLAIPASKIRTGYKLLQRTAEPGVYRSAWDGSQWELGQERCEGATPDHTGGYYYYATLDEVLLAAAAHDVFGRAREHGELAVVEVEARGRHYEHEADIGTKLCATRVRPIREIASTLELAA